MQYLSFAFIVFVAIVLGIYNITSTKYRWIVLLCASLLFYLTYDTRYILFLLFVASSTFVCAKFINKYKKRALIICIMANFTLWFVLKCIPWMGSVFNTVMAIFVKEFYVNIPDFLVPIGISYYVLLAISYLMDVYNNEIQPENNFAKYLLYLSYFPTVVQGPISKYRQIREQLTVGTRINFIEFKKALLLIGVGLIKKMVIADRVALLANYTFSNYLEFEGVILYIGAISYSIQLYMDFSGCVDICRGVSSMFGIDLIDNFNAPYFARSIKEFWGRWHISLSNWLKEYIYIPLGGNRKGINRKYINLLMTFIVSGIWHGAGFNYLFWGLLHGMYQVIGDCCKNSRIQLKKYLKIEQDSLSEKIYQVVITFHLVTFAWIFFRADRFMYAIGYVSRMFSVKEIWRLFDGSLLIEGLNYTQSIILLVNILIIIVIDYFKSQKRYLENEILKTHVFLRWCIYLLIIFDIILWGVYGNGYSMAGFLYGGF